MLCEWLKDEHVYIDHIHHPWSCDVMLSYDLWLDVGCNFTYAIKTILVVNVSCDYL
jgi:hypothetical protein